MKPIMLIGIVLIVFGVVALAYQGITYTRREKIIDIGLATIRQAINVQEGLRPKDFKMPGRTVGDPPLKEGPTATITVDVNTMVFEYYRAMDWDLETGKPSKKKLPELGLEDVARELWP
jgi:aldehyde:ferredoxin oxidoreductase